MNPSGHLNSRVLVTIRIRVPKISPPKWLFISLCVISVLYSQTSFAGCCKLVPEWRTIKTKHFAINYYKGEEEVARRLVTISEEVYETISKKFNVRPWGRTEVVILSHHDVAKGLATPIPYKIIMVRTSPPLADSTIADYDDWLRNLFLREYTHIVHLADVNYPAKILKPILGTLDTPNGLTPSWMTDGISNYFETANSTSGPARSSFTDMVLRTDILQRKFLHLNQMAGTQYEWPSPVAPYLYGSAFWQYLSDTYGEESLIDFSHKYGSSLWLFSLNHQSKKVFRDSQGHGKTFELLWKDWKTSLEKKYAGVAAGLAKNGLKEGAAYLLPKEGESYLIPTLSADGKKLAYLATSTHHMPELRWRDLETGQEKVLLRKQEVKQISFSPDGERLIFSYVSAFRGFCKYSDIYEANLSTGKIHPLTKGDRARDPDFSPDGKKIITVLQRVHTSSLVVYDVESRKFDFIAETDQFDHPRWLSDGQSVVVSAHHQGQRDLWILNTKTKTGKQITSNSAMEDRPVPARKLPFIYFSSDKTGIPNIYRYDLRTQRVSQITNVLTGAFAPSLLADGTLIYQLYNGQGFRFNQIKDNFSQKSEVMGTLSFKLDSLQPKSPQSEESDPLNQSKKYNAFPKVLLPHFLVPKIALIDGSLFASLSTESFDPVRRHIWHAGVTYRNDNKFFGSDVGYTYGRFLLPFSIGYNNFAVNYGDVFGLGTNYFEERKRGTVGFSTPPSKHKLTLNYFFEDRKENAGLPAGSTLLTLGHYAGLFAQYSFQNATATPAQISLEEGVRFTLNYEISNSIFGAGPHLEQSLIWADSRVYIPVPIADHHVLALRAAGGRAFGDLFLQGNFSLGGSAGEGIFSGTSTSRIFTLRGLPLVTFSRDRAWVTSVEYRMPLSRIHRGPSTFPIALNNTHLAFFADLGDAFDAGEKNFQPMLGVGSELRADFVLGYHLPLTARLGYGIILTNRARIAGVKDGLTGADVRNGVVILDIGASF